MRSLQWVSSLTAAARANGCAFLLPVFASVAIIAVFGSGLGEVLKKIASPDAATLASVALRNHHSTATPVTIVDIDARTQVSWGSPVITPRETLFKLIEKISNLNPLAVVVDVDLAATSSSDAILLASFLGRREASGQSRPPLLLVRKLSFREGGADQAVQAPALHPAIEPAMRAAGNVKWISALLVAKDDFAIRKLWIFNALCGESSPRALPSAALAVEVIRRAGISGYAELEHRLALESAAACRGGRPVGTLPLPWLRLPNEPVPISYLFGGSNAAHSFIQTTETSTGRRPLAIRLSARDVEESAQLSRDAFEGRAVLIGGSHPDSQDLHQTPLGQMAGVHILANTIAGARDILGARFPPDTMALLFASGLFAFYALVGVLTRSVLGVPLVVGLTLLATVLGLWAEFPPFVIQQGALMALGMLVVFLSLLKTWQFAMKLAKREKTGITIADLILSETGKRLFGRSTPRGK